MKEITDKQDIASVKIDGNDYEIPKDLALSTLGFFVMNSNGIVSKEADKLSTQAQVDSLFNPEEITEQTLISALIGAPGKLPGLLLFKCSYSTVCQEGPGACCDEYSYPTVCSLYLNRFS